jgi:hypothetical protein
MSITWNVLRQENLQGALETSCPILCINNSAILPCGAARLKLTRIDIFDGVLLYIYCTHASMECCSANAISM